MMRHRNHDCEIVIALLHSEDKSHVHFNARLALKNCFLGDQNGGPKTFGHFSRASKWRDFERVFLSWRSWNLRCSHDNRCLLCPNAQSHVPAFTLVVSCVGTIVSRTRYARQACPNPPLKGRCAYGGSQATTPHPPCGGVCYPGCLRHCSRPLGPPADRLSDSASLAQALPPNPGPSAHAPRPQH